MKKRHLPHVCLTITALAALALPGSAGAAVIYTNLASPNSASSISVNSNNWAANGFTTGASAATLSDVILALESVSTTGTLTVSLYSNVGNAPGTNLATLGTIAESSLSTSSFTNQQFNASFALAANTSYFVVLSGSTNNSPEALWERENGASGTGVAGNLWGTSVNSGGTWGMHLINTDFQPLLMQVDTASSTPEPGTLFGVLGGALLMFSLRFRRSHS
jgi:hypothetical protein